MGADADVVAAAGGGDADVVAAAGGGDGDVAAAGGGDGDVAAADGDPGVPPSAYRPTVSAEEERAIRAWHGRAYTELRAGPPGRHVTHLGRAFLVPEHVFPPAPMSALLGAAVLAETRPTDRVLDIGTGSGVNAVLAASVFPDVLDREVVAEELLTREGETVVYRTYRLTVSADADRAPSAR